MHPRIHNDHITVNCYAEDSSPNHYHINAGHVNQPSNPTYLRRPVRSLPFLPGALVAEPSAGAIARLGARCADRRDQTFCRSGKPIRLSAGTGRQRMEHASAPNARFEYRLIYRGAGSRAKRCFMAARRHQRCDQQRGPCHRGLGKSQSGRRLPLYQRAKAASQEEKQAAATDERDLRTALQTAPEFNPNQNPLAAVVGGQWESIIQSPTRQTTDPGTDTDADGLTDFVEERIGTSLADEDSEVLVYQEKETEKRNSRTKWPGLA